MVQVIEQTRDEKIAMYMKLSKREIVEILLNNQELLSSYLSQRIPTQAAELRPSGPVYLGGRIGTNAASWVPVGEGWKPTEARYAGDE